MQKITFIIPHLPSVDVEVKEAVARHINKITVKVSQNNLGLFKHGISQAKSFKINNQEHEYPLVRISESPANTPNSIHDPIYYLHFE